MKDRYVTHRLTKQGLVLQGSRCEMALSFDDLAVILSELSREINAAEEPHQEGVAAGWPGSRQGSSLLNFVRQEQPYAEL